MTLESSVLKNSATANEFNTACRSMGMEPSTAIDIFVTSVINFKEFPFTPKVPAQTKHKRTMKELHGCMKGKIWMADDFNAPLEDFKEYME